jgi:hypothetical protein
MIEYQRFARNAGVEMAGLVRAQVELVPAQMDLLDVSVKQDVLLGLMEEIVKRTASVRKMKFAIT